MIRRLVKGTRLFIIPLMMAACASRPPDAPLPVKDVDLLVLGGSVAGVSAAGAVAEFEDNISVLLVDENDFFITEPYVNLYLVDKMDEKLLFDRFETVAENKGYRFVKGRVEGVDSRKNTAVLNNQIIRYKALIDVRYADSGSDKNSTLRPERKALAALQEAIVRRGCRRILIDASGSGELHGNRALELYYLLSRKQNEKKGGSVDLLLDPQHPKTDEFSRQEGAYDLVINYPKEAESGRITFGSNFFMQYNHGLEVAGRILREEFKGNFLPNMVGREQVILTDYLNLKALDIQEGKKLNATEYLSKVLRIKREIVEGRERD